MTRMGLGAAMTVIHDTIAAAAMDTSHEGAVTCKDCFIRAIVHPQARSASLWDHRDRTILRRIERKRPNDTCAMPQRDTRKEM